ncbi:MAG TPA: penicillin-binding protein 2 [Candidatus Saccharimonadales bacterium]|nr:penicillin-binding protein 2 [Candidatus Saccharimonadales bacterium]
MKKNFYEELYKYNFFKKSGKPNSFKEEFKYIDNGMGLSSTDKSLHIKSKTWQTVLFASAVVFFFFLLIAKGLNLQIFDRTLFQNLADQNRIRSFIVQAERGVVYDRKKTIIVRNKPAFSIEMDTNLCSLQRSNLQLCLNVVDAVAEVVDVDRARVTKDLNAGKSYVVLANGLTKDQILPIEANLYLYPSISVAASPERDYLYKDIFAHLVGYVGYDDKSLEPLITGKMGIEESYNNYLTGVPGSKTLQVDSSGRTFELLSEKPATPGKDIQLYVDKDLQTKAYELLAKAVADKKAEAGVVVAQDPKTGGILAMVSYPSFDPNELSSGISSAQLSKLNNDPAFPFFNRAISATYPPGSTFKLVVSAAALVEKIVDKSTTIFDKGFIQVGTYIFRNWKLSGHGEVNFLRALQVSNDTYFYTVGGGFGSIKGLGIKKLAKWAKSFGFGSKTGVDLDGEVSGNMPDGLGKDWYLGDTYITAIGQGDVLATPLQVNNVTSYFANGGHLYVPRVAKSVDGVDLPHPKPIAEYLTDDDNYDLIRQGMKLAVLPGGTAYPLFDFSQRHPGIELAGKTGTSEYTDIKGEAKSHAWFTVFGPYKDPTISLTVFLEGGGSGADEAAPIAKELLDSFFAK